MGIVDQIRALCDQRGITLNQLEKAIGLKGTIARWNDHDPGLEKVRQVAQYFGISVSEIIGETKTPTQEGERQNEFEDKIMSFLRALPKERLRGILLALEAPTDVIAALDQQE